MSEEDRKAVSVHSMDKGQNRFEVNGVMLYAPNHYEAIRKFLRKQPILNSSKAKWNEALVGSLK